MGRSWPMLAFIRGLVEQVLAELRAATSQDEVAAKLRGPFVMELALTGPDKFRPFFDEQVKTWGAVIRENGLKSAG